MSINGEMVETKCSDVECSQALLFSVRGKVKNVPPFLKEKMYGKSMLFVSSVVFYVSERIHKNQIIGATSWQK